MHLITVENRVLGVCICPCCNRVFKCDYAKGLEMWVIDATDRALVICVYCYGWMTIDLKTCKSYRVTRQESPEIMSHPNWEYVTKNEDKLCHEKGMWG